MQLSIGYNYEFFKFFGLIYNYLTMNVINECYLIMNVINECYLTMNVNILYTKLDNFFKKKSITKTSNSY